MSVIYSVDCPDAILAQGVFPSTIEITRRGIDGKSVETLFFSPVRRGVVEYPLALDMLSSTVMRSQGDSLESQGLKRTLSAIEEKTPTEKPSFEDLIDGLEARAIEEDSLAATLKFLELTQLYGAQLSAQ